MLSKTPQGLSPWLKLRLHMALSSGPGPAQALVSSSRFMLPRWGSLLSFWTQDSCSSLRAFAHTISPAQSCMAHPFLIFRS